jgi:hypothetical protein
MAREGVVEQPLDWNAVIRDERARWWRDRWRDALDELPALAARVPAQLAEAALEIVFDAARHTAIIAADTARACMAPDARMEFSYSSAGERQSRGLAAEDQQSMGVFLTTNIPGAQVVADQRRRTVTVDFLNAEPKLIVVLVPEDPGQAAQIAETARTGHSAKAVFEEVGDGAYLLAVGPTG